MQHDFLVLVFVGAWSVLCAAQTQQDSTGGNTSLEAPSHTAPAPALTGGYLMPEGQDEGVDATWTSVHPIVPAMVGGYGPSLVFGEEMERSNFIRGGVTAQATYDDNPFASNGSTNGSTSNYAVSIFPQIAAAAFD